MVKMCVKCSAPVGRFAYWATRGMCSNCFNAAQKVRNAELKVRDAARNAARKVKAEQERVTTEEAERIAKEARREHLVAELPKDIREGGFEQLAQKVVGDEPVLAAAFAVWPEETSAAERVAGEIGVRLLTGGFVGRIKTESFGVVALNRLHLWRIMLGYLASGTYSLWRAEEVGQNKPNSAYTFVSHLLLKGMQASAQELPSAYLVSIRGTGIELKMLFPGEGDMRELFSYRHGWQTPGGGLASSTLVHPIAEYARDNISKAKALADQMTPPNSER